MLVLRNITQRITRKRYLTVILGVCIFQFSMPALAQFCDLHLEVLEKAHRKSWERDTILVSVVGGWAPSSFAVVHSDGEVLRFSSSVPPLAMKTQADPQIFDHLLEAASEARTAQQRRADKLESSGKRPASIAELWKLMGGHNCTAHHDGIDLNVALYVDGELEDHPCDREEWAEFNRYAFKVLFEAMEADGEPLCQ